MKYLIICKGRLGDVISCLPAARRFKSPVNSTVFYCQPQYRELFSVVPYVREAAAEMNPDGFDRVFNMNVDPYRHEEFRKSGKPWREFVYGLYDETRPATGDPIIFENLPDISEYGLPEKFTLLAPFGYSQSVRPSMGWWLRTIKEKIGHTDNLFVLSDTGSRPETALPAIVARKLSHLPVIIRAATEFFTINSAPNIIAGAVREKQYYKAWQPDYNGQDNVAFPNQVILKDWW
jgi:hypothetical protein